MMLVPDIGEGNGTPLPCSCLENALDGVAWWAAVHGVAKSWTRLSGFTFTFHFHTLEKEINPLQCSCLGNPRDGGAWWAAVYEVAQSRTRLKWLSSSSSTRYCVPTTILTTLHILFLFNFAQDLENRYSYFLFLNLKRQRCKLLTSKWISHWVSLFFFSLSLLLCLCLSVWL